MNSRRMETIAPRIADAGRLRVRRPAIPRYGFILLIVVLFASGLPAQNPSPRSVGAGALPGADLAAVDQIMNAAVAAERFPGGVVLVGHDGQVVYRKAFGMRSLEPRPEAMTVDTIFDLASMTKCIADGDLRDEAGGGRQASSQRSSGGILA